MSNVTQEILRAWDDDEDESTGEPTDEVVTDTPEESEEEEEQEQADGDEAEDEDDEAESDEAEEDDSEEAVEEGEAEETSDEEPPLLFDTDDPEVIAFMRKYQDDPERAIKGSVQLQRALGRQGQEKAVMQRRIQQLEQEMAQQQSFSNGGFALSQEQREWVNEALESGNPQAYVQRAVQATEFDLARAVCGEWARESPFEAMRIAQAIDNAEYNYDQRQVSEQIGSTVDRGLLMTALVDHFPEMPLYEEQMTALLSNLGPAHPMVVDAHSDDPETAARGIIGIYEIARAQTATVKSAREKIKQERRQSADGAKRRAQVSSASASPSAGETPRPRQLMPGLTLEQLDAEWNQ